MLDPYKLSYVSAFIFGIFLCVVFLLRKKKYFHFFFLIGSSLLPLLSLLRKGVHQSGDFAINVSKTIDLHYSLTHGIFPVHWASLLNGGYGYPLFLFTYPLPYYAISLLKFAGFSFIDSEKIVIALAFILSGTGIYLFLKLFLKPLYALFGAILYLFAPYHLVDMHFRVALGELFAYAALPYTFYFLIKLLKDLSAKYFLLLVVSFSSLILSHQAISLISTPFLFLLPLITGKSNRQIAYIALFISLVTTAFYWLPAIEAIGYTHQPAFAKSVSFENPALYLFSPWRYGLLFQGPTGQLAFPMGIIQLSMLVFVLILMLRGKFKKLKKHTIYLLIIFLSLSFMLLPVSEFLWKSIPFISNFQFSYRLMLPISFLLAIAGAIAASKIKNNAVIYLLMIIAMSSTILNWGTRATIEDITDKYLYQRIAYTTAEAEGLQPAAPKWRDIKKIWEEKPFLRPLEIVNGKAIIVADRRTPVEHSYFVSVIEKTDFVENTYYFPGWNLYVDGKNHKFTYEDREKTNLIRFTLDPGSYDVTLRYKGTKVTRFANTISVIGVVMAFVSAFYILQRRK